jgi:hypothetical protein
MVFRTVLRITQNMDDAEDVLQDSWVKERYNFQLRLDAFNAFNHTQYNGINRSLNFDAPGSTNVQNAAANNPAHWNGFGSVSGVNDPRILQLLGRFTF